MSEPNLSELKSGWIARGDGWAVRAETKEEAIRLFHEREDKYREIDARPFLPESEKRRLQELVNNQLDDERQRAA